MKMLAEDLIRIFSFLDRICPICREHITADFKQTPQMSYRAL